MKMKNNFNFWFWAILVATFTINLIGYGLDVGVEWKLMYVLLACIGWELSSIRNNQEVKE